MSIKKISLCVMFCVVSVFAIGQTNLSLNKKVFWNNPVEVKQSNGTIHLLQFSNMGDLNPETNIPYISESIKLDSYGKPENIKVTVSNQKYIWPTPEEHKLFKDKVDLKSFEMDYSLSRSRQQYYIDLSISPVIKPLAEPTFKKLVSYTVNISYDIQPQKNLKKTNEVVSYAENSILSSGSWVKVSVEKSGIHKISYAKLNEWGFSNPQNVGLYGNGGKMIPSNNSEFRHDDLVENSIWHHNNAIYFYAEGPVVWKFNYFTGLFTHSKHKFSNYSYYFLTEKSTPSQPIENSSFQEDSYNVETDYFTDFGFYDEDNFNLIKSGSVWFGEKFDYYANKSMDFNFEFPNAVRDSKARIYLKVAARANSLTHFVLLNSNTLVDSIKVYGVNKSKDDSFFAKEGILNTSFINNKDNISLRLDYGISESQASSLGYLDYMCLNVNRYLMFEQNELSFRNLDIVGNDNIARYNISKGQGLMVWDITNPLKPLKINPIYSNNILSFNYKANELKEFVAFDSSANFPSPEYVEEVENQNLHATPIVDYIIVCHPDFTEEANRLGQIHNEHSGISYTVATTNSIYNEFSSGKPDVTAIRSFVKMLYDRAGNNSKKPENLLLFGDGSYDNRQGIEDNTNKIPTYQSDNSIHFTRSFVSDDYFGLLDENEGWNISYDKVDIGIGRFPVNTIEEAKNAVDKTYRYLYQQSNDFWKSELTFIGDDGDRNIHMRDANSLTIKIEKNHPGFNINRFYFDSFEKVTTTSGNTLPEIEEKITNAVNNGTLIFNYTGHGGTNVLAHEHIVEIPDIEGWNNIEKLSLFVTATCEFSRFDEKEHTSAGELVFLNPLGGGIALFSTTRIVYSSLNKDLNHSFYDFAFERDDNGKPYTFGQIMRRTKNKLSASVNKLNFTLLGDPALRLIYPKLATNTLKLNNKEINLDKFQAPIDSLKALSTVELSGEIIDLADTSRVDFNGQLYVSVFDKQSQLITRGNGGASPFSYKAFENVIFRGPVTVKNGEFKSTFTIPKDIRYNFDNGKICYYAFSDNNKNEAFGAFSNFMIGGIDDSVTNDNIGPTINLWLNNKNFTNGEKVGSQPILIGEIYDDSGINTTGNGIGHDITCIIDNNTSNPIILNDDFQASIDSYKSGELTRQLLNLDEGKHSLIVKAWDTHNNSSSATLDFLVSSNKEIETNNASVFPNPVETSKASFISFEHNDPNARLDLQLMIFNMAGEKISERDISIVSLLNTIPPIELKTERYDGSPLSPGVYIYKIIINSQTERKGEVSGKFMVAQ